jgi:hypothetical protein
MSGGLNIWPLAVSAQQGERMRRIGVLMDTAESNSDGQARIAAFREVLQGLGWTEGRNIQIDYRWGVGDVERRCAASGRAAASVPQTGHAAALPSPAMNSRRRIAHAPKPLYEQPIAVGAAWEPGWTPAGHRPSPKIAVLGAPFGSDRRRTGHDVGALNSTLMTQLGSGVFIAAVEGI